MDDFRIFIGKIPQGVSEAEIRAHFGQFGKIEHVQCPTSVGKPFCIAFVTYASAEGRDKAISTASHNLGGSPLNVVKASPKPSRGGGGFDGGFGGMPQQSEARIFVGHIPEDVTEEMLQTYFSTYGTLLKCFKPAQGSRSVRSTDPPGYAFVTFSAAKEKHLCLAQEDHVVNGHSLRVMEAKPKPQGGGGGGFGGPSYGGPSDGGYGGYGGGYGAAPYNPYGAPSAFPSSDQGRGFQTHGQDETNPRRVFISHMQPSISDGELRTHFSQFGLITDVFIPQPQPADSSPTDPKGFAYVSFEDSQSVYRAMALKEHIIHGSPVDVQEARPKSSRRQPPPARGGGRDPRVFIGKIPKHINDDSINTHFSQFGEVKEFYRPREQNSRDGFAFGFLTYTSINELARCLAVLEHVLPDGTVLSVTRARPRPSAHDSGGGGGGGADSGFGMAGGFGGGAPAQAMQAFGQAQGYGAAQAYGAFGQQQQFAPTAQQFAATGQQQFAASPQTQQFTPAQMQQFAAQQQGQYGVTPQPYALNQGAYAGVGGVGGVGQIQQTAQPTYGATQHQRTSQRYNPY